MIDNLPPLPTPEGFRTRYRGEPGMIGHYPWGYTDRAIRKTLRPEHEDQDLFTAEQMQAYARAAIEASRAAVPAGMVLVPAEPTPEMLAAMQSSAWLPGCYRAMLAAAPQQVAQPSGPQYLCKAWGETDLPAAAVVSGLDGVRAFLVEQWLGDADHEHDDGTKALPAAMEDMQAYWETEGECWSIEFEIGGVSVQKVFHAAPSQVAPAKPEQAAQPLTDEQIHTAWASENGLEDCDMCKLTDFTEAVRFVERLLGIGTPATVEKDET